MIAVSFETATWENRGRPRSYWLDPMSETRLGQWRVGNMLSAAERGGVFQHDGGGGGGGGRTRPSLQCARALSPPPASTGESRCRCSGFPWCFFFVTLFDTASLAFWLFSFLMTNPHHEFVFFSFNGFSFSFRI